MPSQTCPQWGPEAEGDCNSSGQRVTALQGFLLGLLCSRGKPVPTKAGPPDPVVYYTELAFLEYKVALVSTAPLGVCTDECECVRCDRLTSRSICGNGQGFTGTQGILGLRPRACKDLLLGHPGKGTPTRLTFLMRLDVSDLDKNSRCFIFV